MKEYKSTKYYWGIGLENETYMQFEKSLIVSGDFIQEKIGRERYSLDYTTYYKPGSLDFVLKTAFDKNKNYFVSRMMNSHSLEKLDTLFNHRTLPNAKATTAPDSGAVSSDIKENPEFLGKTILDLFLDKQPFNIKSMVTTKTNPMGSICFDGDSIEFVTKYFENRTVEDSCNELRATKQLFIDKINESEVLSEKLHFPKYNSGFNMFMSNQKNIVLFNNGTFHFHITLPTYTENSRIADYNTFDQVHINAMYLLQWFQPLYIATLGSPDIMGVISQKYNLDKNYALGSMRNAMSRYIGVGTFNKAMGKGKILTYKVEDFRKFLKFKKEDNIWWRDQIENDMEYILLAEVGLDFNQEKMYQSGFELRSFDEFPIDYLNDVLHSIILICEHSLHLPDVSWSHNSIVWNNLIFKSLKHGYTTEINTEEKLEILKLLQLIDSSEINLNSIDPEFEQITRLDAFFFKILEILNNKYKDDNVCINAMFSQKPTEAPKWDNFNKYQIEQHLKQIEEVKDKF